jgi:hypothetical protein
MSHRRLSFSCILSLPLLLSKSAHQARESEGRRRSPPSITNGAAPANPSPREQVYSRPAVGLSVREHRQRAQGRRKGLPATTCQRNARASCYGVRSQFGPRGRDTTSDRGPPFQLTLHVTAGHRSAGTSRRRSVLEASDLSVEQARFPVLFARNVEPHRVSFENRRDLGEFLTGGW